MSYVTPALAPVSCAADIVSETHKSELIHTYISLLMLKNVKDSGITFLCQPGLGPVVRPESS